jgi:hypothetical protein
MYVQLYREVVLLVYSRVLHAELAIKDNKLDSKK